MPSLQKKVQPEFCCSKRSNAKKTNWQKTSEIVLLHILGSLVQFAFHSFSTSLQQFYCGCKCEKSLIWQVKEQKTFLMIFILNPKPHLSKNARERKQWSLKGKPSIFETPLQLKLPQMRLYLPTARLRLKSQE